MVLSHSTGLPNWRPGRWSDNPELWTRGDEAVAKNRRSVSVWMRKGLEEHGGHLPRRMVAVFAQLLMSADVLSGASSGGGLPILGRVRGSSSIARTHAVGVRSLVGKYSGSEVKIDNDEYMILREAEILAVINRSK